MPVKKNTIKESYVDDSLLEEKELIMHSEHSVYMFTGETTRFLRATNFRIKLGSASDH